MIDRTKCYINGRFLTQSITGVQRTATELVNVLDRMIGSEPELSKRYEFTVLAPRRRLRDIGLQNISFRAVGKLNGHAWEQFELPWFTRDGILVSLCNTAPLAKLKQMVMIHDASVFAVPETYSFAFRVWYKLLYPSLGKISRRIMTISEFSRAELNRYANINTDKIAVIYLAADHINTITPDYSILDRLESSERPFLLAVSSMSPNKNFQMIIKAVDLLKNRDFDVVVAGGTNPRIFRDQDIDMPDTMQYLGYVSDGELRALYEKAIGFVFPSRYEGFGLPPVEAMFCGCPVIVADIITLREVCAGAALYCDPDDPSDLAHKMCQLIADKKMRAGLVERGRRRASRYTWHRTATGLLEQLRMLTG